MDIIRVSRSIIGQEESKAVSRVILEDGYLGMGNEVQAFETELALFLGIPATHVACVSSGTAALHLAVEGLLQQGDEVLVQSLTFLATFQAISAARAVPVACEVIPETLTIDLADAKRRLTKRTKAIMPVHYASNPGDLDAIYVFAKEYGLRVIEDAAHAFGCTYRGRKIGNFGDVVCFSFDGIKNITSGEGGAVISWDPNIIAEIKDCRLLGVEKDTDKRYANQRSWAFDVKRQGYRYHMSNIFAAIGRVQLKRFISEFAPKRVELAQKYRERLKNIDEITLLETDLGHIVPHIQPIRVLNGRRDAIRELLKTENIETGIHYKPNHLLNLYGSGKVSLPITESIYNELLTLPLHPGLYISDVNRICDIVISFLHRG